MAVSPQEHAAPGGSPPRTTTTGPRFSCSSDGPMKTQWLELALQGGRPEASTRAAAMPTLSGPASAEPETGEPVGSGLGRGRPRRANVHLDQRYCAGELRLLRERITGRLTGRASIIVETAYGAGREMPLATGAEHLDSRDCGTPQSISTSELIDPCIHRARSRRGDAVWRQGKGHENRDLR